MKLGLAHWILALLGFILVFSAGSKRAGSNELMAETTQLRGGGAQDIDPLKAAQYVVNETRKAWSESYEGDPGLAKQKFAQSMKKVDQEFAPVRAMIDKSPESSQKAFTLEYLEQMNKLVREQIKWLESKIVTEGNPKWKQDLQRHLKDYKDQYPKWEAELQQSKSELR
jgi:hypothetical protein